MIVDWVSAVFHSSAVGPIPGFVKEVRDLFDGTVLEFNDRRPINAYDETIESPIGKVALAWGGNGNTVFLKIPGDACARVSCWVTLREFLRHYAGWLTRVDLAYDDFEGEHPVEEAVARYRAGEFVCGGRPPRINCAGNWLEIDGYGRTLYIGKVSNGKGLCVYEKGKQLKDSTSVWVRWEARFSNVDRVLPVGMLTEPSAFFAGAYPALDFVVGAQAERVRTRKAQERISVADLTNHASRAYGGLVAFLMTQGAIAGEVVSKLRREVVPRRLSSPTADELEALANGLAAEAACNA